MIENPDVKVVVLSEATENAYRMGYNEFDGMEIEDTEEFDVSPFQDSARYCNHILPTLRSMSGYRDNGYGTYTENGKVVIVEFPEDRPMNGDLTESHYILEELSEAWHSGVYDAIEGNEFGNYLE